MKQNIGSATARATIPMVFAEERRFRHSARYDSDHVVKHSRCRALQFRLGLLGSGDSVRSFSETNHGFRHTDSYDPNGLSTTTSVLPQRDLRFRRRCKQQHRFRHTERYAWDHLVKHNIGSATARATRPMFFAAHHRFRHSATYNSDDAVNHNIGSAASPGTIPMPL